MKTISISVVVSILITLISLVIPKEIMSQDEAKSVKFWYPIRFMSQDITTIHYNYPKKTWVLSIYENPTDIDIKLLVLSILFYFTIIQSIIFWIKKRSSD